MRPGLTGLWQVSARSDPNLESRIRYDLFYLNQWSLLLDAKIVAKTVPVVVLAKGGLVDRSRGLAAPMNVSAGELSPRFDDPGA
jgi:hypothetical protein